MSALSKQKATNLTRGAQATFALLVLGAGAAVAVSSRFAPHPEQAGPLVLPVVDVTGSKKTDTVVSNDIDFSATADRLAAVSNHPKPVVAAPVVPDNKAPSAPVSNELKYLGAVGMGANKVALIAEGAKQRFVNVNDDLAGGKVESITDTEVKISGGVSKTITLAGRSADVVTRSGRPGPANGATPGVRQGMTAATLQPYQPQQPNHAGIVAGQAIDELRAKNNVPDYIARGEEQAFIGIRESLRGTEKVESEEQLNELASKIWEEKRGGATPELERVRKERGDK